MLFVPNVWSFCVPAGKTWNRTELNKNVWRARARAISAGTQTLSANRVRCCWKLSDVENVSWHLLFRRRPQVLSAPFLIVRQLKVTGEVILNQASVCCHSKLLTDQLRGLSVLLQPCKLSCEQLKEVSSAALFDRHWEMVFPTESSAWL